MVYTSGVVCEEEGKDITQQTKEALDYLDRLLAKCKSDKHHIMSMQVRIFLVLWSPPGLLCVASLYSPETNGFGWHRCG